MMEIVVLLVRLTSSTSPPLQPESVYQSEEFMAFLGEMFHTKPSSARALFSRGE
jgi:hypothetical protein